jgi:hypothetical protein
VDFLLTAKRDRQSAARFLRKAINKYKLMDMLRKWQLENGRGLTPAEQFYSLVT